MVGNLKEEALKELKSDENIQTKSQLEDFYSQGYRNSGAAFLRLILMAFVCFWNFGFPEPTGILFAISGFAIPCFYILSGYFILPNDKMQCTEKTKRKIKRSLFCFVFLLVLYLSINILIFGIRSLSVTASKRALFNFLMLNLWPLSIGSNIWFIQAMLLAYAVIYIAAKLNLLRFYKAALILLFLFMLLSGEFAGLIRFHILGYSYIPGNWITRALPYVLLGKFLREKEEQILRIASWKYIVLWIVGAGLAVTEIIILAKTGFLVYEGHMIGYGIMAFSACGLALSKPLCRETRTAAFITHFDPLLSGIIYILMDPIYYIIGLVLGNENISILSRFGGLAAFAVSILLALILKNNKLLKLFFS